MDNTRWAQIWLRLKSVLASDQAETVIRLLVVLSIILSLAASYETAKLQKCQTAYTEVNAAALKSRDAINAQDREAVDRMVLSVSTATSRVEVAAALKAYNETRAKADAERAKIPLPVPQNFC